ncbi:MAG: hypothetical protein ACREJU_19500 [Nitrospiraceae bacterium]
MSDVSSLVDASLVLLGAVGILMMGIGTSAVGSNTVSDKASSPGRRSRSHAKEEPSFAGAA